MDIKDMNIFDVASLVMKFITGGVVAIEHEGSQVQPHAVDVVKGKVLVSTKVPEAPTESPVTQQ